MSVIRVHQLNKLKSQAILMFQKINQSTCVTPTKYALLENKNTGISREVAYQNHEASQECKVMFIPGFMSNKSGIKATALSEFCQEKGFSFTRYDPTGLGESRPIPLSEARLSHWIEDAEKMLTLDGDPKIVVGSSMGAWISLHLCIKYPKMFRGLLLIAPGINFTKRYQERITKLLPESAIKMLEEGDTLQFDHPEYGEFPISLDLVKDMYQYELDLTQGLNVNCPVRIVHGILDEDVPYMESMDLLQSLKTSYVHLTYIKDGDHRLCRDENLQLIFDNLMQLTDF